MSARATIVVLTLVLVALLGIAFRRGGDKVTPPPPAPVASMPTPPAPPPPPAKPSTPALLKLPPLPPIAPVARKKDDQDAAPVDPVMTPGDPELSWDNVDMEKVRAVMPDNIYWRMSAPTKDPEIIKQREEEQDRWNVEYGKVLSNTATAEEIDAYYDYRQKLANDDIAFAGYVLAAYGQQLPERDVALLKLAVKLNLARLEEIPRQIIDAQQRREEHDAARRAWLEDQRAFEAKQESDAH